jgi:hypothetical protein
MSRAMPFGFRDRVRERFLECGDSSPLFSLEGEEREKERR